MEIVIGTAKRAILWSLVGFLCLFGGCLASWGTGRVTVIESYAETEKGLEPCSYAGFPVWWRETSPFSKNLFSDSHAHGGRAIANWFVWSIAITFIVFFIRYILQSRNNAERSDENSTTTEKVGNVFVRVFLLVALGIVCLLGIGFLLCSLGLFLFL